MPATASDLHRPMIAGALPQEGGARLAAQIGLAIAGTMLLTLAAKARLVLGPVDMSLQTLAVMLIGAGFGLRLGVATVALYLFEGALGLPVFQGTPEKGFGVLYMIGPTGGYLLGFLFMVAVAGWAADRGWDRSPLRFVAALLVAEVGMTTLGFGWLSALIGAHSAWVAGVLPFVVADLVKVGLAAALVPAIWTLPLLRDRL